MNIFIYIVFILVSYSETDFVREEEPEYYVRCINKTGVDLEFLQFVYLSGADGNTHCISIGLPEPNLDSLDIIGYVHNDILMNDSIGYVRLLSDRLTHK